ncbi:MAG TPA: hypothetical protein VFY93_04755 [Planctomycetota bacterium]|nr:hypothetical protein [Planctomycetota bacterium]
MNLRLLTRAVPAAVLLFTLGCGGGGGMSELTVSEQNAAAVAASGVGAVSMLEGMTDMMDMFSEDFLGASAQMAPCPDGGQAATSINDVTPAGLSTGDSVDATFYGCMIDVGGGTFLTFNGMLGFDATEVTGDLLDPAAGGTRTLTGSFGGLTLGIVGATITVNGAITVSVSTPDADTFTSSVSGSHFSAYASAGVQSFSGALDDFSLSRTWTESTGDYSLEINAQVYSSELGGFATFETTTPFTGNGEDHPSSGTLVATGAMGATVTLIALDNVNVQILIDADWDGVNETTINTTWDALENNQ